MLGRRHLLALLAIAVLGVTASFVVQLGHGAAATAADPDAAVVSSHASLPAALTARVTAGAEQLAADNLRSRRLIGFTLAALLVLVAVQLRSAGRRRRGNARTGGPAITCTRITPPRAPPLLRLIAS